VGRADAALHESKVLGRNRVESFSVALQSRIERRSQLEEELRAAIAHRRFEVHFQPIWARRQSVLLHDESASLETLRRAYEISGFEALAAGRAVTASGCSPMSSSPSSPTAACSTASAR
jgi:hypothetical protein